MKIFNVTQNNLNFSNKFYGFYNPYLYMPKPAPDDKFSFKDHKLEYLGGGLTVLLALITLTRFANKKTFPRNIVEIANKDAGLNKITDNQRIVKMIKDYILYPLKSVEMGHKHLLKDENFKTGIIICSKDAEKAKTLKDAIIEHANLLGIQSYSIDKLTKKNKVACAYKTLNEANNNFTSYGKVSIADLGNLSEITNLLVNKTKYASKLEKRLVEQKKGVLWTAWTDKVDKVPYFYSDIPTLLLKID